MPKLIYEALRNRIKYGSNLKKAFELALEAVPMPDEKRMQEARQLLVERGFVSGNEGYIAFTPEFAEFLLDKAQVQSKELNEMEKSENEETG